MLQHLSIQNYALIDKIEVDFSDGLTIITGETGAGKSILLGALGLIAGNRADTKSLQDKTKKCIVEATFNIKEYSLQAFFEAQDLDFENESVIRREINPAGKSRAFINDTPVSLTQLKELAVRLIDIHSQHKTLTLNGSDYQLSVVDIFSQHEKSLVDYTSLFKQVKLLEKKLDLLLSQESQAKKDLDYFQFQFDELEEANLISGEQVQLEQELETLNNSEDIKSNLSQAIAGLEGGEQDVLSSLNEIKSILNSIAQFKPEINELSTRVNSSYIELVDISKEIESIALDVIHDPEKIEDLTNRLDTILRLQQKHQVKNIDELISTKDGLSDKLLEFNSLESEIEKTKKELTIVKQSALKIAQKVSIKRKKVIPTIEKEITSLLSSLSMKNAQLKIGQLETEELTINGLDKINFLFSANKGSSFNELNKVASGGELSRLMLSIKSLLAKHTALPTIIFDEIDTGVSGDIANKVGNIMNGMASNLQVIAITHLPQIASKGKSHLLVYKEDKKNKTFSNIETLDEAGRIQEVAKMLSTGTPTPSAIKNAKELLKV